MVYFPERYINPLTDFGFKRLFDTESNKDLLIDFLNVVLPENHKVQDLEFHNNENISTAIFDIYCQGETGEKFIVEIQRATQNYFKDRSVYYSSFPIQERAEQGNWNYKLTTIYAIGILDFVFDNHKDDPTIKHLVELKNQRCEVLYDKLKFISIELPKFRKRLDELETRYDKWLFLLRHLDELEDKPEGLDEAIFSRLFEVAEIAQVSRRKQQAYMDSLKHHRDLQNVVDTARQAGREEGRRAGLQAVREEGLLEVARKMLLAGGEIEAVCQLTELPEGRVQALAKSLSLDGADD